LHLFFSHVDVDDTLKHALCLPLKKELSLTAHMREQKRRRGDQKEVIFCVSEKEGAIETPRPSFCARAFLSRERALFFPKLL
jgi:hypothetical protein